MLECVHQARLPNPWLPHHKDDLPLAALRLLEMRVELTQYGLAADELGNSRNRVSQVARILAGHFGDELVPALRSRLDDPRRQSRVAERLSNFEDEPAQHFWLCKGVRPDRLEQLLMRHKTPGVFDEVLQDGE